MIKNLFLTMVVICAAVLFTFNIAYADAPECDCGQSGCWEPGKECAIMDAHGCSICCDGGCATDGAACNFGFGDDAECWCTE